MPGRFMATLAVIITFAGCAGAKTVPGQGGPASDVPSVGSPTTDASPAEVAHITCEKDAVKLEDPVVRAERDGVHLLVKNAGGAWGIDLHHEAWAYGSAEGFQLLEGSTPDTSSIGPGSVTVSCLSTSHASYSDPGVPTASLTIVDPDGMYVPPDLTCGSGEQFRMKIAADPNEDPEAVFRRVPGVLTSDVFKKSFYPDSPLHWPTVVVFRDRRAVAMIGAPIAANEWELVVNACPGSAITTP